MPCLLAVLTLLIPRAVIVVLWVFSGWFNGLFETMLWPVLGFIFLPTTLIWFTVVQHWFGGEWGVVPIVGIVIALVIDLSPAQRAQG